MKEQEKQILKLITSRYSQGFREALDECVDKTMDFGTLKLLQELFDGSLEQVGEYFIGVIKKSKEKDVKQTEIKILESMDKQGLLSKKGKCLMKSKYNNFIQEETQ